MMAEAFFGYLLPWGNMSYWGAQVIVSLFGALPAIGETLAEWIRGDFYISDITLNRFFAFHVIAVLLPFFLPWLDRCPVKSIRYRGWIYKLALAAFAISFLALGYLGLQPVSDTYTMLCRLFAIPYFGFFILMPLYTSWEKPKAVPERVR